MHIKPRQPLIFRRLSTLFSCDVVRYDDVDESSLLEHRS